MALKPTVGMNVPLNTESNIKQEDAANDILTITQVASATGDFLVMENSSGTDLGYFDSNGDLVHYKTSQSAFGRTQLAVLNTAPSSAGLTKGDIWLAKATTDVYRLALCASTAGAATRYGSRFAMTTIGSGDPALSILAGDRLDISAKGAVGQTTYARPKLAILNTAPASAGLSKGDLWLAKATTDVYRLAMCISTAGAATRYGGRFAMSTIGSGDPSLSLLAGDVLDASAKGATGQASLARVRLAILNTAPASAAMSKGDLFLAKATTDVYRLAMCISSATGTARYGHRFGMSTIGAADSLNIQAGDALDVSAKGAVGQTSFARLRLPVLSTAPASGNLSKGDLYLAKATTDAYRLAMCISSATSAVRYSIRMHIQTLGAAT